MHIFIKKGGGGKHNFFFFFFFLLSIDSVLCTIILSLEKYIHTIHAEDVGINTQPSMFL